jgi:hypothetical protein
MKINQNSLIFEVGNKNYISHHINWCEKYKNMFLDNEKQQTILDDKIRFLNETNFRRFVLSKRVWNNLSHYEVPKSLRMPVIKQLPNRKDIIMIDEFHCIKYMKNDNELIITMNYRDVDYKQYDKPTYMIYFRIDLITGNMSGDNYDFQRDEPITHKDMIESVYGLFMLVVTYLELTDVSLKLIEGGKKSGDIFRDNFIKNETKLSVIQVNSNWNIETIRIGSFDVRGHWRLQGCGKGRQEYKYVWVRPFKKGLIKRLSQKELIDGIHNQLQTQLN